MKFNYQNASAYQITMYLIHFNIFAAFIILSLLSPPLKSGLSSLFEDANLCGLYSENRLVLTDARHRAFLALTEEGVEAGAVTSVAFSRSYLSFSALQPFIMMLWSDQASVPLFIGRVTDP